MLKFIEQIDGMQQELNPTVEVFTGIPNRSTVESVIKVSSLDTNFVISHTVKVTVNIPGVIRHLKGNPQKKDEFERWLKDGLPKIYNTNVRVVTSTAKTVSNLNRGLKQHIEKGLGTIIVEITKLSGAIEAQAGKRLVSIVDGYLKKAIQDLK